MKITKVEIHQEENEPERIHIHMNDGNIYFIDSELIPDLAEMASQI